MAAPRPPPCAWQHTGNPQLMNSPGARVVSDQAFLSNSMVLMYD